MLFEPMSNEHIANMSQNIPQWSKVTNKFDFPEV